MSEPAWPKLMSNVGRKLLPMVCEQLPPAVAAALRLGAPAVFVVLADELGVRYEGALYVAVARKPRDAVLWALPQVAEAMGWGVETASDRTVLEVQGMKITKEALASVRTLFRDGSFGLWGLPYVMNHSIGQGPRDIWNGRTRPDPAKPPPVYINFTVPDPGPQPDWLWLGGPGWWGGMTPEEQVLAKEFLDDVAARDLMPRYAWEWQELPAPEEGCGG